MAQRTQPIAGLPRSFNSICPKKKAPSHLLSQLSWRAASTDSRATRNPSNVLSDPEPQQLSHPISRFTAPIRTEVTLAPAERARSIQLRQFKERKQYISSSESRDHRTHQRSRRVDPKKIRHIDPYRDNYYVPPERPAIDSNLALSSNRTQHHSFDSPPGKHQKSFRPQTISTIPYQASALRRYPQQRPSPLGQQQKSNLSVTPSQCYPVPSPSPEPIDIDQYHRLADTYIDNLVTKLEAIQEERDEVDCEYTAGVLTLAFPPVGTYVLNKQPPNRQIWLSSPISGPKRYDWVAIDQAETDEGSTGGDGASRGGAGIVGRQEKRGGWVYLRDGSTLTEVLEEELGVDLDEEDVG
ncbi:MAG: hypothetical protein Q9216_003258 [Gyalolechia sp. 2 TL-2023]